MSYPWLDEPVTGDLRRTPWLGEEPDVAMPPPPGRRVEVVRHIDLWSVLKVSLVLYFAVFLVGLVLSVALWLAGRQVGVIGGLEELIENLGLYRQGTYHFRDGYILRIAAVVGPILVVLASLVTVAGAALFNLVARLTGGVEVTMAGGDSAARTLPG